jgi:hypothetical protein
MLCGLDSVDRAAGGCRVLGGSGLDGGCLPEAVLALDGQLCPRPCEPSEREPIRCRAGVATRASACSESLARVHWYYVMRRLGVDAVTGPGLNGAVKAGGSLACGAMMLEQLR